MIKKYIEKASSLFVAMIAKTFHSSQKVKEA